MEKICVRCGHRKEISEFRLNNRTRDGYTATCKDCLNHRQNEVKATQKTPKAPLWLRICLTRNGNRFPDLTDMKPVPMVELKYRHSAKSLKEEK